MVPYHLNNSITQSHPCLHSKHWVDPFPLQVNKTTAQQVKPDYFLYVSVVINILFNFFDTNSGEMKIKNIQVFLPKNHERGTGGDFKLMEWGISYDKALTSTRAQID